LLGGIEHLSTEINWSGAPRAMPAKAVTAAIVWLKVRAGWCDPVPVRQYPLGREEARQLAAETAAIGMDWEDLLNRL
jgi:hypothetical protein